MPEDTENHKCPICFNIYDGVDVIPMIAGSCGHSTCESCVLKMKAKNRTHCPLHPLGPPDEEEKWHKNYLAIDLLRFIKEQTVQLEQQVISVAEMWSTGRTVIPGVNQNDSKGSSNTSIAKTSITPPIPKVENVAANFNNFNIEKNVQKQPPLNYQNPINPPPVNPIVQNIPHYVPPAIGIERNTIFISNLNRAMSKLQIYKEFRNFGKIMRYGFGNEENVNKGFMEMEFEQEVEAANAIRSMNGAPLGPDNQPIKVVYKKKLNQSPQNQLPFNIPPPPIVRNPPAVPRPINQPQLNTSAAVFVDNLGPITKEELWNIFAQDGPIVHVKMGEDARGSFNGTATIFFAYPHYVANALRRDGQPQPGYGAKMRVEEYRN